MQAFLLSVLDGLLLSIRRARRGSARLGKGVASEEEKRACAERLLMRDKIGGDERERARARRRAERSVQLHRRRDASSVAAFDGKDAASRGGAWSASEGGTEGRCSRGRGGASDVGGARQPVGTRSILGVDGAVLSFSLASG